MNLLKKIISNRKLTFIIALLLSIGVLGAFAVIYHDTLNGEESSVEFSGNTQGDEAELTDFDNLNKVTLSVTGLSCSSCVQNIKDALASTKGIKQILVDVGGGKADIYFDPAVVRNPGDIAIIITNDAGYPAEIDKILDASAIKEERDIKQRMSTLYIASINDRDLSRADFDKELGVIKDKYSKRYNKDIFTTPQGLQLEDNLKLQVLNNLIDFEMMLADVAKANYTLDEKQYDTELERILAEKSTTFEEALNASGYDEAYFKQKVYNQILINKYLDDKIFFTASNSNQKGLLFNQWYSNVKALTTIVYYNDELQQLIAAQSGGSCGSGGGGGGGCCP